MEETTMDQKTEVQPKARERGEADDRRATARPTAARPTAERDAKDDAAQRPVALHDWASI
jgi:hypothetical protein